MDSKLPKPTLLRKPTTIPSNHHEYVPSDPYQPNGMMGGTISFSNLPNCAQEPTRNPTTSMRRNVAKENQQKSNHVLRSASNRAVQSTAITKAKTIVGKSTVVAKKAVSSSTVVGVKRIPPYDYKARFIDLSAKHNILKEKFRNSQEQNEEYESLSDELVAARGKIFDLERNLTEAEAKRDSNGVELKQTAYKLEAVTVHLQSQTERLSAVESELKQLKDEHHRSVHELSELRRYKTQTEIEMERLNADLTISADLLFKANIERRELHNAVMDLRGNIRVFCRIRPPLQSEEARSLCGWTYIDDTTLEISSIQPGDGKVKSKSEFSFDQVLHDQSTQEEIFEMVSPLIQSAFDGYNVCIFAYGQTGSGKTYTMEGDMENVGIIPRSVDLIFNSVEHYRRFGWEYEVRVTCLEIYNETLYDLLSNELRDLEIRMVNARNKTEIYVSNITDVVVTEANALRHCLYTAKQNRTTACTAGNERSSRSHAVTRIQLIGRHAAKQETCIGTVNLIDLAGSESPKTSQRMGETKNINRSLSELTNVIMALLQRHEHVPYRNSKLTYLLMPCLGGNSKTLMFINASPFQDCYNETIKSLRFASSVNACKMAKTKRNRILTKSDVSLVGAHSSLQP